MLSLISPALLAHSGLTDPSDPVLTVRLQIKDGEDPQLFLVPSDGNDGPLTAVLRERLKENPAPKVPGSYIWKVHQFGDLVTLAQDKDAARFLFSLMRRDLGVVFEELEDLLRALPTRAQLQDAVDRGVHAKLLRMVHDGQTIDPRELRLVVRCPRHVQMPSSMQAPGAKEGLATALDRAIQELKAHGCALRDDESTKLHAEILSLINAPPLRANEFLLSAGITHAHPFFDLCVQLMEEAGNDLLRERAPVIAEAFIQRADSVTANLRSWLAPR
ncbi:hypothetical protein HY631_02785 [Candidatus Uhrbacteria bacterium]|nr:hypothetical protein [Candidatus Uhrbacteria bacterium]